jgi:hypothetical protein
MRIECCALAYFGAACWFSAAVATPPVPNDPDFGRQWGLLNVGQVVNGKAGKAGADVAAPTAWEVYGGTSNVIVAIVGTGVDPHPEFADRLLEGYVAPLAGGDPYSSLDTTDHGTRVAGIIAAARNDGVGIAGINDRAWILPVRVVEGPLSSEAAAAQGMVWAVDAGAGVIVVPLQYYDESEELADAIDYAVAHDALVIAPTGNLGEEGVAYPAAFDGCLAVSATDSQDNAANFSNYGPQVDLAAPSVTIWSTRDSSDYGFETLPSVGWAAAHVGGVASLIRSYAPQLTADQVRQILIASADDLGDVGWDPHFGAGRLNAGRALESTPAPALHFEYVEPLPTLLDPQLPNQFRIRIANAAERVLPDSVELHYRLPPGDFLEPLPMAPLGGDLYRATLPAAPCETSIEYYLRAMGDGGGVVTDPLHAPGDAHSALAIRSVELFSDDFETDQGWQTLVQGQPFGAWTRVAPNGTSAQPEYDYSADGGHQCFITGQHPNGEPNPGANDVDGGPVQLLSPVIALFSDDVELSYARWFYSRTEVGDSDTLSVEVSRDAGATWTILEIVTVTEPWTLRTFRLRDFPQLSGDLLQLRFATADLTFDSLTEAAIDEVSVREIRCTALPGDADGDGDVDALDFGRSDNCWRGPGEDLVPACASFDSDRDGDADLLDFQAFQHTFGLVS